MIKHARVKAETYNTHKIYLDIGENCKFLLRAFYHDPEQTPELIMGYFKHPRPRFVGEEMVGDDILTLKPDMPFLYYNNRPFLYHNNNSNNNNNKKN